MPSTIYPGVPYADTDRDGMVDIWENLNGFDPNDPSDGPQDADGDGYTNLEEFLNGTAPTSGGPAPTPAPTATPVPPPVLTSITVNPTSAVSQRGIGPRVHGHWRLQRWRNLGYHVQRQLGQLK